MRIRRDLYGLSSRVQVPLIEDFLGLTDKGFGELFDDELEVLFSGWRENCFRTQGNECKVEALPGTTLRPGWRVLAWPGEHPLGS